jgi:hypothetical protein
MQTLCGQSWPITYVGVCSAPNIFQRTRLLQRMVLPETTFQRPATHNYTQGCCMNTHQCVMLHYSGHSWELTSSRRASLHSPTRSSPTKSSKSVDAHDTMSGLSANFMRSMLMPADVSFCSSRAEVHDAPEDVSCLCWHAGDSED